MSERNIGNKIIEGMREAAEIAQRPTIQVDVPVPNPGYVSVAQVHIGEDGKPYVRIRILPEIGSNETKNDQA